MKNINYQIIHPTISLKKYFKKEPDINICLLTQDKV